MTAVVVVVVYVSSDRVVTSEVVTPPEAVFAAAVVVVEVGLSQQIDRNSNSLSTVMSWRRGLKSGVNLLTPSE